MTDYEYYKLVFILMKADGKISNSSFAGFYLSLIRTLLKESKQRSDSEMAIGIQAIAVRNFSKECVLQYCGEYFDEI